MTQFGEVSWSGSTGEKSSNAKELFLKLDDGENKVRIITLPHQYLVHRIKVSSEDKYGQKVYCARANGDCPVCAISDLLLASKLSDGSEHIDDVKRGKDMKSKSRWFVGVLSRKEGKTKILDLSYTVLNSIRNLSKSDDWGDPTTYDLNILVDRNGGATGYYNVQPCPKKPLTADEQVLKDNFDISEMQHRVTPPKPEQTLARLNKLKENAGENILDLGPTALVVEASVETPAVTEVTSQGEVSDDDDFPSFAAASA